MPTPADKLADEVVTTKQLAGAKPAKKAGSSTNKRPSLLQFAGKTVRLVVKFNKAPKSQELSKSELAEIIADAKGFLAQLEDKYAAVSAGRQIEEAGVNDV